MSKARQFIKDYTRGCSNELCAVEDRYGKKVISYHKWLTPEQALAAVEIAKEEVIDKACDWLKGHWREYVWLTDNDVIHFGHWQNDFRKAMEE